MLCEKVKIITDRKGNFISREVTGEVEIPDSIYLSPMIVILEDSLKREKEDKQRAL